MSREISKMKNVRFLFSVLCLLSVVAVAQVNVQKGGSGGTNNITGDLNFRFGKTLTIGTGAVKSIASGTSLIVQFEGDSLTDPAGYGSTTPTTTWTYYLTGVSGTSGTASTTIYNNAAVYNCASSGATYATTAARYAASVLPHAPGAGQQSLLFYWIGLNDIGAGTSAATLYANVKTYWATAVANGFTVIAFTITPASALTAAQETQRQLFNDSVRSDPTLFSYLMEMDAAFPVAAETTFYQAAANSAHFKAYGNQYVAIEVNRVIFQGSSITTTAQAARSLGRYLDSFYTLTTAFQMLDGTGNLTITAGATNGNLALNPAGSGAVSMTTATAVDALTLTNSNGFGGMISMVNNGASGRTYELLSTGTSSAIGAGALAEGDATALKFRRVLWSDGSQTFVKDGTTPTNNGTDTVQIVGSIIASGKGYFGGLTTTDGPAPLAVLTRGTPGSGNSVQFTASTTTITRSEINGGTGNFGAFAPLAVEGSTLILNGRSLGEVWVNSLTDAGAYALQVTGEAEITTGGLALLTAGKTVSVKSGSNAAAGTFTMVAGSATVTSTAIDVNTVVLTALKTSGGTAGIYAPLITVAAGSFTATTVATDTSTYNWVALKVN